MADMLRRTRRSVVPRVFPDMDRLFGDLWNMPFWGLAQAQGGAEPRKWAPQVDLYETESELVIKAELPGIGKEDVEVFCEGRELAIRAERRKDEEVNEEGYYRRERVFGHFERVIQLPTDIDEGPVSAKFDNGVLEVRATKKGPEPKGRKIDVA